MIEKLKTPKHINWDDTPEGLIQRHRLITDTYEKINELVDAVNKQQQQLNNHMCRLLVLEHPDLPDEDDAIQEVIHTDPYAEQRKWEGKLCWFWDADPEDKIVDVLSCIDISDKYPYVMCDHQVHYKHCEPVKPDDDIIYKGGDNDK